MKSEENNLIVNGYLFGSAEDAELARQEAKKTEYLDTHMDYSNQENILLVYKKALNSRIFKTPIGLDYLKKLRTTMIENGMDEHEIPPVLVNMQYERHFRAENIGPAPRILPMKKETFKSKFIVSVLVNLVLVAAVAAMFYIAINSSAPNILNYEEALTNKYAQWEQDLKERETILKEKESGLNSE